MAGRNFSEAIQFGVVKANLEKQQIENEQRVSVAETDAKVMELQNSKITESTLKLKELADKSLTFLY